MCNLGSVFVNESLGEREGVCVLCSRVIVCSVLVSLCVCVLCVIESDVICVRVFSVSVCVCVSLVFCYG